MVTKSLELIFDFGSPNAYLCMKALPELLDRTVDHRVRDVKSLRPEFARHRLRENAERALGA